MNEKTTRKRITFKYCAPEAKSVVLAGSFNGWNAAANHMKKGKDGVWSTTVNLLPGTYEYLFIVDGEWKTDPTFTVLLEREEKGDATQRIYAPIKARKVIFTATFSSNFFLLNSLEIKKLAIIKLMPSISP